MQLQIEFEEEIWKDVVGYEGIYKVSSLGNIMSLARRTQNNMNKIDKVLVICQKHRYLHVGLTKNKIEDTHSIHRLVATAFIPNPENKPQVNHKNGNKHDNRVKNLQWATRSENQQHAVDTGLRVMPKRGAHFQAKKVVNVATGKIFDCITDAFEDYGIGGKGSFIQMLNGIRTNKTNYKHA